MKGPSELEEIVVVVTARPKRDQGAVIVMLVELDAKWGEGFGSGKRGRESTI